MKGITIATATAVLLTVSGCKTLDPFTGEEKISNTAKFGAIGAVLCGAVGSRKSSKRARNAAVGCGLIGMGIGAYMDAQEKQLRTELESSGIRVVREGDNIRLVMPNSITFAVNQSTVQSSIYPTLESLTKVLQEFDETRLLVAGHTDSSGADDYNYDLSVKRAANVSQVLQQKGVASNRLSVVGYGETRPIANNNTSAGKAQNRRVELLIQPQPNQQ